jgi:pimeloyl-ACP methyl ester carboxylesterase
MNFTTLLSKTRILFIICFFFSLQFLIGEEHMLQTNQKNRYQEPKLPFPYLVEEVSYGNSEISLSGTLTLPRTTGPYPAVILIHGSSALDRDETILGHKPFLVLSDHFTRHGIAVLRFDKRGVGKSTGIYDNATIEDFCYDVAKGVEYLKSRPEIIKNQIGLVGHSEGGIIAPMLAAKSNDVAFIVLMAGTGVNGEEIFCEQGRLLHRGNRVDEEMIAIDTQVRKIFTGIVKKETNCDVAKEQIHEALAKFLSGLTENEKTWVKIHSVLTEELIKRFNSPWGHFYFPYEPSTALRHITIPTLVLNGDLDLVVSPKQNLPFIDEALKEAGNKDYTIIELPKLNHAFQTCEIGSWDEYEQTEETIAPSALNIMTDWILERTIKINDRM